VLACRFLPVFPEGPLVEVERREAAQRREAAAAVTVPALERL